MKTLFAAATLTLLAACSGGADADDVEFMQGMIPHHEQAIAMAKLAPQATDSLEVLNLANRIESAQGPEIRQMTEWLETHEEAVEPEHGAHSMEGMASEDDLASLRNASGGEFDRQFLTLMIAHHQGAIEMADQVLEDGADADVQKLAKAIIEAQQTEIDEMKELLP